VPVVVLPNGGLTRFSLIVLREHVRLAEGASLKREKSQKNRSTLPEGVKKMKRKEGVGEFIGC